MSLITIILTLIVVGFFLWAINRYIPMQSTIKNILNLVVVAVVVIWLLYGFGLISSSGSIRLPRIS